MITIHATAEVSAKAKIGYGTKIWHQSQIREGVVLGKNCVIGKGVYLDKDVTIGDFVKIQNYSSIYQKAIIEDGVFIGPYVCLANDLFPRAITHNGKIKEEFDWNIGNIIIHKGASLGAGTIVLPNIEIGSFALIGAQSLITKNVPNYALVYGSPGKIKGFVCKCGSILTKKSIPPRELLCKKCSNMVRKELK